jgi:hypothetical protein
MAKVIERAKIIAAGWRFVTGICRQACGPAGISEPGLAARFGGGCGRSNELAGLPGCCA